MLNSTFSPTGELTKEDFVSEFTKLYKKYVVTVDVLFKRHNDSLFLFDMFSGNATNYCDYIFPTIDKDRSGTINFYEFMDAVAHTSTGNTDNVKKRLELVGL